MNTARLKTWIFNPFMFIAGLESLLLGLVIMFGAGCFGFLDNTHFDGVLDVHIGKEAPFILYMSEQLIAWAVAVLVFYPAGLILSRSHVRLVDIAGTMALSRWPMIIISLVGFFYQPGHDPFSNMPGLMTYITIQIFFSIWMIAMMYNAFKISCNVRGEKAVAGFIISLVIAEVISKVIFFQVYQHIMTS